MKVKKKWQILNTIEDKKEEMKEDSEGVTDEKGDQQVRGR